jgi:hypothetical protein
MSFVCGNVLEIGTLKTSTDAIEAGVLRLRDLTPLRIACVNYLGNIILMTGYTALYFLKFSD